MIACVATRAEAGPACDCRRQRTTSQPRGRPVQLRAAGLLIIPSAEVFTDWSDKLFAERAPFLYEPVAAVYLLPQLAVFVSVGIVIGWALGLPLALNVALAVDAAARVESCRRRAYTPALGVLPTFLMGFACCAPTVILVLGTNVAASLMSVFIPLRTFLLPLAVVFMGAMLLWSVRRMRTAEDVLGGAGGRDSDARGTGSPRFRARESCSGRARAPCGASVSAVYGCR